MIKKDRTMLGCTPRTWLQTLLHFAKLEKVLTICIDTTTHACMFLGCSTTLLIYNLLVSFHSPPKNLSGFKGNGKIMFLLSLPPTLNSVTGCGRLFISEDYILNGNSTGNAFTNFFNKLYPKYFACKKRS